MFMDWSTRIDNRRVEDTTCHLECAPRRVRPSVRCRTLWVGNAARWRRCVRQRPDATPQDLFNSGFGTPQERSMYIGGGILGTILVIALITPTSSL
jgi:hypothetical protein